MKRVFTAVVALLAWACAFGATYPANSPLVRWVGRYEAVADKGDVRFDWSGTYADFVFTGSRLEIKVSDSGKNYFNIFVDGVRSVVRTEGEQQTVLLFEGSHATHRVRLQRRTEGFNGLTTLHSFTTDGTLVADTAPRPTRHIEFIGDSLTAGYGTDSASGDEPYTAETQNCDFAYGCYVARYFGADYNLVAHSGQGMVRNYGDPNPTSDYTMIDRYDQLFDEADKGAQKWTFGSTYTPDLVVIFLGTNDFSTKPWPSFEQFSEGYKALIAKVRGAYGESVPVLCVSSYVFEPTFDYVWRISHSDEPNLHFACVLPESFARPSELGASEHPNRVGQKKFAMLLIPYISTITGWSVE